MRYKVTVSYDGTFFHGFQRQPKDISVQEVLEKALAIIFKEPITIHGAGRTDAFVHAKGQVFHFDHETIIPEDNLKKVMNKRCYPHIYITDVKYVDSSFDARKSAIKKEYRYYVSINEYDPLKSNYMLFFHDRIDISKIREAMTYIVGTHDFRSFARSKNIRNTVRTIESFDLNVNDGVLEFRIVGNGFLYNMVRIIISVMLKVGEGRFQPEDVQRILNAKSRKACPFVAAPQGLVLYKVMYDEKYE